MTHPAPPVPATELLETVRFPCGCVLGITEFQPDTGPEAYPVAMVVEFVERCLLHHNAVDVVQLTSGRFMGYEKVGKRQPEGNGEAIEWLKLKPLPPSLARLNMTLRERLAFGMDITRPIDCRSARP